MRLGRKIGTAKANQQEKEKKVLFDSVNLSKESEDGLSRSDWRFKLVQDRMVIEFYGFSRRLSKDGPFETIEYFDHKSKRSSTLTLSEVPLTEKIKRKVVDLCALKVQQDLKVNYD